MAGFEAQEGFNRERADPDLLAFLGNDTLPYLSLVKKAEKDGLKTRESGVMLKTQILKMRIYDCLPLVVARLFTHRYIIHSQKSFLRPPRFQIDESSFVV